MARRKTRGDRIPSGTGDAGLCNTGTLAVQDCYMGYATSMCYMGFGAGGCAAGDNGF